jgi:uncharacterized membrane protein YphA (DoxX/SURF4 family)
MRLNMNLRTVFLEITYLLYIVLFVYAATNKLLDFENFQVQLGQSPLLSSYAGFISYFIPFIEFVIVAMMCFSRTRYVALFSAFCLMVMFSVYIFIMLNFSPFVPCSCGGILEKFNWKEHLIFNLFFVLLSVIAIILYESRESKVKHFKLWGLGISAICSISIVTGLFLFSEDMIHKRNNFTRRFTPQTAVLKKELDLKSSNYYIAGIGEGKIYLANNGMPLKVIVISESLSTQQLFQISLPETDLRFRNLKITVKLPFFYVTDGTTPCIFRGLVNDWKGSVWSAHTAYFTAFEPIDSSSVAIRAQSSATHESVLGIISKTDSAKVRLVSNLLEKQIDGIFDTDGNLIYNSQVDKIIYTYFYRNQYVITDKNLQLQSRENTIDTTSRADIKVTYIASRKESKLASPARTVNKITATYGRILYVNAGLMGKYESKNMWRTASIIDAYDFTSGRYSHSFYIYDKMHLKMREFRVEGPLLVALVGNYISIYSLKY